MTDTLRAVASTSLVLPRWVDAPNRKGFWRRADADKYWIEIVGWDEKSFIIRDSRFDWKEHRGHPLFGWWLGPFESADEDAFLKVADHALWKARQNNDYPHHST